jgi:glycosyltransferase involved in cell wall biosynthesis
LSKDGQDGQDEYGHMISVVIPTYNRAALVVEAVESVLRQEADDFEIIVVDDGSDDDTRERLAPFLPRIRLMHQIQQGVSAARNAGIGLAEGEWLAFLDSDDLWLPQKLARQMEYLHRHPELRICQTDEVWMRNGRRWNPKTYHQKPSGHCFEALLERCLVSPSAVMLHRELIEEVGEFDVNLPACEDYDMWLRIGWRHPIGLVPEPLVIKRGGHPDQLSASVPALDLYRIRALEKLYLEQPLDPAQRRQVLEVLQRKCVVYSQGCLKRGRPEEAAAIRAIPELLANQDQNRLTQRRKGAKEGIER